MLGTTFGRITVFVSPWLISPKETVLLRQLNPEDGDTRTL